MFVLSAFPAGAAAWLAVLLHVSAKAALVLVTAAAVCFALRRASASLRHLVWTLAIVCILCLPLLSMVLPTWQVGGLPRFTAASANSDPLPERALQLPADEAIANASSGYLVGAESGSATVTSSPALSEPSRPASVPSATPTLSQRIPSLLLSLWALGTLAALIHVVISTVCVRRAVRQGRRLTDPSWQRLVRDASAQLGLRRPVTLLSTRSGVIPMVWGWRHAILLLPADAEGWSPQRRRLVVLHELAHVRRADCPTQMLGYLARALYWFNPLAWVAIRQLRREREQACDDLVLNSGLRSSDYAAHLLGIASAAQRPTLAYVAAVAMARPAGLEARIRAILDARRTRRAVPRAWALMVALAATGLLAAVASVQGADAQLADQIAQHGLGAREQWQPQLADADARLEQPVHIEIIGRAAVPALAMLSEETGVSLQVAPENLDTVGERKLTVIAQGCSLKGLMVQIPQALQECHWDIDPSGPEPVYLLHRNGGADAGMAELHESERRRRSEEQRPAFESRIAEARQALAMSPEELKELEQSDLLLARAAQDPEARKWLELFASLPDDRMQELAANGWFQWDYFRDAPERFQEASRDLLEARYREAMNAQDQDEGRFDSAEFNKFFLDHLSNVSIGYQGALHRGISLRLETYRKEGNALGTGIGTVPPKFPDSHSTYWPRKLLLQTGTPDEQTADALLAELVSKGDAEAQERQQRKREAEWREPRSPALRRTITLPFSTEEPVARAEVQRLIAHETGLSLVSDYFTGWGPMPIPEDALASMPAWRLLYLLGEKWFWSYEWAEMGDCLVFHDRYWYRKAPRELPESLIEACREKLDEQDRFTLEDVVAIAQRLASRRAALLATGGGLGNDRISVPSDLERAGLKGLCLPSEALLIYGSLSPEQRDKALHEDGLPYAEMTPEQRELVRRTHRRGNDRRPLPEKQISQAVFRVRQRTWGEGSGATQYLQLLVVFPSREVGATLRVGMPAAAAGPAPAKQD
jgi:beta-lactamase regulating signal transducer with metallopeptidase domain